MLAHFRCTNNFFSIGGFSLGHHSVRAATPDQIQQAQSGWRLAIQDFLSAAPQINLNFSGVPGSAPLVDDPFSQNISLTNVVDTMLANMDAQENVKLWFNNKVWPSYPIYLNAMSNALLRTLGQNYGRIFLIF